MGAAPGRRACVLLLLLAVAAAAPDPHWYCLPADPCWPGPAEWQALNGSVGGQLASPLRLPGLYRNASVQVYANWEHSDGTTSSPWALPAMAVMARNAADAAATVRFAAAHRLRLTVKSSGHSYTGRSTAAGSLLLSLKELRAMEFHDHFDDGCGGTTPPAAVTVQPGVTFGTLYPAVDAHGFAVVGGGGPTVSAAGGYLHGGGHGPLGRALGLGADNVLRLDVVLPNGTQVSVTPCSFPELWWALRGGGGGTFGVVVAATHRLHADPGIVVLQAGYPDDLQSDGGNASAWLVAVAGAQAAVHANWSCYLGFIGPTTSWNFTCVHYGGDAAVAAPGIASLRAVFDAAPAGASWEMTPYPTFWTWKRNDGGDDTPGVSRVLSGRILPPEALADPATAAGLVQAIRQAVMNASDVAPGEIQMHIGLLLGGAAGGGRAAHPDSAVSRWMREGLWHTTAVGQWPSGAASEAQQVAIAARVRRFGDALRALVPEGGAYLNEDDFDEPDWRTSFFSDAETYARLAAIKHAVDPQHLLCCRNCVGYDDAGDDTGCAGTGGR